MQVSRRAFDDQAGLTQLCRSALPDEECDIAVCLQQPTAKVASDGTRSNDEDSHVLAPDSGS
jgi:hypothetical protein